MIEWACMQDKMPKQLSSTAHPVIRHTHALQESTPSNPPNMGAALSISPEGWIVPAGKPDVLYGMRQYI